MALNKQQIRDFVRSHMDIEIEDLPDAVLDVFIAEGFHRIVRAEKRWPFYVKRWSISTVADTDEYNLDTVAADIREIASIKGERYTLKWIGSDTADVLWPVDGTHTAEPTHWVVEDRTLLLYPSPGEAYDLVVRGYRIPADFGAAAAGDEPDLPLDLHNTVAVWALAKAYLQQEDPEMAAVYERQFADELNLMRRRLNDTPAAQPLIAGGGHYGRRSIGMRFDGGSVIF